MLRVGGKTETKRDWIVKYSLYQLRKPLTKRMKWGTNFAFTRAIFSLLYTVGLWQVYELIQLVNAISFETLGRIHRGTNTSLLTMLISQMNKGLNHYLACGWFSFNTKFTVRPS